MEQLPDDPQDLFNVMKETETVHLFKEFMLLHLRKTLQVSTVLN